MKILIPSGDKYYPNQKSHGMRTCKICTDCDRTKRIGISIYYALLELLNNKDVVVRRAASAIVVKRGWEVVGNVEDPKLNVDDEEGDDEQSTP